ncbi:MAG: isoprenylcysteine carboxylmethyltransferase family protein [Anaerolineae bacterium]|nr:isoprenylcysteine carboxylmethyltransferase family protein [Anaerolineae bacterium]
MFSSALILSAYFIAWAGVHSLLASLGVKRWARRTFGAGVDRWYRTVYVLFALASFAPIPLLFAILPHRILYVVPAPWRWLMVLGQVGGAVGAAAAIVQTGAFRFVGLVQMLGGRQGEESGPLQVRGLYCYVRHPGYFFSLVVIWLTPVMTVNLLVLFALFTLYFYVGSIHEESRLVAEFGAAYEEYQRHVPRLIPRLYRCYPAHSEER